MFKNRIVITLYFCFIVFPIFSQIQSEAKDLFEEGDFYSAMPVFEELATKNPSNIAANYYYGACLFETGNKVDAEPYLKKAADKGNPEACKYLGRIYTENYRFDDAVKYYNKYIATAQKKGISMADYTKKVAQLKQGNSMLRGTERVQFIDSIIVSKYQFLEAIKLSPECGQLMKTSHVFSESNNDATFYQSGLGNKAWFASKRNNPWFRLYSVDKIGGEWSDAQLLSGLGDNASDVNYPFVLSDGVTLYYAAQGEESLGGYDIFVTRLNTETGKYLKPENMGMPYNSPANDYMYVVDDVNQLGWLVTDRYQPAGFVCIYIFIPNKSRMTYDYDNTSLETVLNAARITSIGLSQTDRTAVADGLKRLENIKNGISSNNAVDGNKGEFSFMLNDAKTYHKLSDFTNDRARIEFQQLQILQRDYGRQSAALEDERNAYSKAAETAKSAMKNNILKDEQQLDLLQQAIQKQEFKVRRIELSGN